MGFTDEKGGESGSVDSCSKRIEIEACGSA